MRKSRAVFPDINIDANPLAALAMQQGVFTVTGACGQVLSEILTLFQAA